MIVDERIFDEDHLPRRLLHRESAVDTLLRAWSPALAEQRAKDVLLHGPSGVGKTVLTRHALQRLRDEGGVQVARVRCLGKTDTGIIRSILEDLPGEDPASNTPHEDLCLALRERVAEHGPVIAVLDEADDVPTTGVLDRLADVDPLSIVAITHDVDSWLSRVDDRPRRAFDWQELGLDRYGVDELADILEARASQGLRHGAAGRAELETIADDVAGVARFGIQALREAALVASDRGMRTIDQDDLPEAYERARRRVREEQLASLPFHHHVLYELIREAGEIDGETLHERYERTADQAYAGRKQTPLSKRARRRKLQKLEDYDLVTIQGGNRNQTYIVCDGCVKSHETALYQIQ
ncbi:Cdc6/Cdc18 family protein [Halovenus marina]|uniref:Cdc6/Cdc18 family protein n=1 Tax=Halovenus marina TaxID=3396621 RepID=UPI003F5561AB